MSPVDPSDAVPVAYSKAFSIASGREPAREADVPPEFLAFARRMVAHGRVIAADTPCPTPWIRRAEGIFSERPARSRTTVGAAIWSLLFDSSARLPAATRGAVRSRFLRIGGEGGAIEAELTGLGTDDVRLVGALEYGARESATGPASDAGVSAKGVTVVLEPAKGAPVRATVGDGGTFDLRVPARGSPFTLSVRVGRRVVARSAPLDVAIQ